MPIPAHQPASLRTLLDQLRAVRVAPAPAPTPAADVVHDVAAARAGSGTHASRAAGLLDELRAGMRQLGPIRLPGRASVADVVVPTVDDAARTVQAAARTGLLDDLRRAAMLLR